MFTSSIKRSDWIYVPDPFDLTYTNTRLLYGASLSLCCEFICDEAAVGGRHFEIIPLIRAWAFITLQIKGLLTLDVYTHESIFGISSFPPMVLHCSMLSSEFPLHV